MTDQHLQHNPLDHLLWAVPDLDAGARLFADCTGVVPSGGGSHDGFGTRNTLASLAENLYFEVISVDPAQENFNARAGRISALDGPEMHTFGVRGDQLEAYRDTARSCGLAASDPVAMSRRRADGVLIQWSAIYIEDEHWGYHVPFLIDWMGSEHPWKTTPRGCTMTEFCALHPQADELSDIYKALGVDVPVRPSPTPGFLLRLNTPNGEVILT
ncbi:VOC family protein [Rhodobacteraceae bacterium F11138]|nr:VOC family protein [Rhodobacteraceae bacterium F11138]